REIEAAAWTRRKAAAVVKVLALSPAGRLHREQITEALWPDLEPDAATNNYHRVVYAARRAIEPDLTRSTPSTYLHTQGELLSLGAPGGVLVDVEAFTAAAAAARRGGNTAAYE